MKKVTFSILLILLCGILTACGEEKPYEIIETVSKVTESADRLELEFQYDIINHSDEDYRFTPVYPSYIQNALIGQGFIVNLPAQGRTSGVGISSVSKDGPEMSKETIQAILDGDLPFVNQLLIGKVVTLNP